MHRIEHSQHAHPRFTALAALFAAACCASSVSMALSAEPPEAQSTGAEAERSELEARYFGPLRQVTRGMVKAGEGYFSPDGQTIVYQAVPPDYPFYQIYTQALTEGVPRRVSTGRGRTTCSYFSPDGTRLLFASSHLDPQLDQTEEAERRQQEEDRASGRRRRYEWAFDPHTEIFEVPVAGGALKRLTDSPGYDAEGAYTPDGRQIVFCSDRDGDPDLYVMNADGSGVRQLTNAPGYDGGPFTSPDGQWVCFRSDRHQEGFLQIFVIRLDGTGETQLTNNVGVNWAPYWHPQRPWLVWTGADHSDPQARPNYDLWLMQYRVGPPEDSAATGQEDKTVRADQTAEGRYSISPGPITRVTDHPSADVLPVFSPDGNSLMWTSNRGADHASQLWIGSFRLPDDENP